MKIRTDRSTFGRTLKIVDAAISRRSHLPILSGVRIEAGPSGLLLTASDLDLTIEASCNADVQAEGVAIASAGLLAGFVKAVSGDVLTVEAAEDHLSVSSGESVMALPLFPLADWPKLTLAKGKASQLDGDQLRAAAGVAFAAHTDSDRGVMRGVWFTDGHAVAMDGYRMAAAKIPGALPAAIVPAPVLKAVAEESKDGGEITVDHNQVTFGSGAVSWTTRVIAGEIPHWRRYFDGPAPTHHLEVESECLLESLSRVSLVRDGDRPRVALSLDGGKLTLHANAADGGEITDTIPADGDMPFRIGFDIAYLRQAVEAAGEATVRLGLIDALKPMILRSDGLEQAVMPFRLAS